MIPRTNLRGWYFNQEELSFANPTYEVIYMDTKTIEFGGFGLSVDTFLSLSEDIETLRDFLAEEEFKLNDG